MRARPALLGLLLLLAGCSERERLNPFDPRNPVTGGRPAGFAAYADPQSITLKWRPVTGGDLLGYQLWRRGPGEADYSLLFALIPARAESLVDFPLTDYRIYAYRFYHVFAQGVGARAAEDSAAPAWLRPWLLDVVRSELHRLSSDGRRTRRTLGGFSSPNRLALDPVNGRLWVANTFAGNISLFESDGTLVRTIPGFGHPTAMVVDPNDHSVWVCDEQRNEVSHIDELGNPVGSIPVHVSVLQPTGAALDPADRSVWICERLGDKLRKYGSDGVPLTSVNLSRPGRVAVDVTTGEAWVTEIEAGRLNKISSSGAPLGSISGLGNPWGVAVDASRGLIWVALQRENAVAAYGRDRSFRFRVTGIPSPTHIAIDAISGEAWVVGAGELWRLTPSGAVKLRRTGLAGPIDLALQLNP